MLVATLQIKNVPEPLHAELRRRAGQTHQTVRDYVLTLIERDQALPSKQDWLGELAQAPRLGTPVDVVELIHEGRAERDAQIDRAFRGS